MDQIGASAAWKLRKAIKGQGRKASSKDGIATVMSCNPDGTIWVSLPGSSAITPVNGIVGVAVQPGDAVKYSIENGRLSITGNASDPATGPVYVQGQLAPVASKADEAFDEATRARESADAADADAKRANKAANAAVSDALAAKDAAGRAEADASSAKESAEQASADAATAKSGADEAQRQASAATESANEAKRQSEDAEDAANAAKRDAADAKDSAQKANTYSNAALNQLGVVQDVAGILTWASEHGTFVKTSDTAVKDGKVYFVKDGTDYTPVIDPKADALSSYYELTVEEAMNDFIMAHLAVTSRGLWVLPSGMGSASSEQLAPGYKMLLAADGSYLYDAQGVLVRSDTASGTDFAQTRDWHVGSDDAFIFFDASEGTITLGGDSIVIGGTKTLSELIAASEQAARDAEAAVQTANDVPIVTLSSTNGTTFKRNLGVSTTIVATIFTPGGRIDNATELRRRFGAGAYLEWGWRDVVTDADHVLVSTDPRIIMDGFGLTVSPDDVDSQAVITCSLNY